MKGKLGATGKYPQGSYGRHDEGELRFAVGRDSYGNVCVDFGKPIAWLAMPVESAIELAKNLLKHAGAKKIEISFGTESPAQINECPSCHRTFKDGETCGMGGCPMGGDL